MKEKLENYLKEITGRELNLVYPEQESFGHFSSAAAMRLAKEEKRSPLEIAKNLAEKIKAGDEGKYFKKIEAASPGFINFWLSDDVFRASLKEILEKKNRYGEERKKSKKQKIQVEFISANPTGPLTMANGRGGFLGDALSNVLEWAGYEVTREYYLNDAGNQIKNLGGSVLAELGIIPWEENFYKGDYVKHLAKQFGKSILRIYKKDPSKIELIKSSQGMLLSQHIFKDLIRPSVEKAGIKFDSYFSENVKLRAKGLVIDTLGELRKKGFTTIHNGAEWLHKEIAGEKERVLRKSNGDLTYYMVDLAYHLDKLVNRKFDKVIDLWGTDHHANVAPIKEGLKLFDVDPERLHVILFQLVRLIRNGEEVKMSKRAGEFVTLDELIKEVGLDAARFFFLMVTPETHMDFDLGLAKERSMKNPVYYVQYAYVRALGILKRATHNLKLTTYNFDLLNTEADKRLMLALLKFPDIVTETAGDYEISRLARYVIDLSRVFHNFYEKERIAGEEKNLASARLALVRATEIVLENSLKILGFKKLPKKM